MFNYLLRKTIYKDVDYEEQNMLIALLGRKNIIEFFCGLLWIIMLYVFPCLPIFIIDICEKGEFSVVTEIFSVIFIIICGMNTFFAFKFFKEGMVDFSRFVAAKIYYSTDTKKGKALNEKDFEIIKKDNEKLYKAIFLQYCAGHCYGTCFNLCKTLKTGHMEIIAAKIICTSEEEEGKDLTMHALFVKDAWAFDAYSGRQYPVEKVHEIYKAKIYKSFSFDDIGEKSYEEFISEIRPELVEWAKENNCYTVWEKKKF